ncbi:MAG: DNA repair protein RecN, partial [Desulfocucumaceae bacterium]
EVDTGIGGTTIRSVARKLKKLAGARQVLCVTHSASVASFADRHLSIVKTGESGRTRAEIFSLYEEKEKIFELARMLGGVNDEAALSHAKQLLEEAKKIKDM